MGAQILVITKETATILNVTPGLHQVKFTGVDGVIRECSTAKITLWLLGKPRLTHTEVLVGAANTNILGFGLLYGRVWKLPDGTVWSFSGQEIKQNEPKKVNLLEISISLPS